ncbi:MAG: HlyD family efflux transporter periplasmic adaptor subunit, partial [bacterium]
EGTLVKKGDFLLQFDISDLEERKQLEDDKLTSLIADLDKLKAQQAFRMSNLESELKLNRYSYEQAALRLEMRKFESEARQEEARLQLKETEIKLKKVQKQLEAQRIIHASEIVKSETRIRIARSNVKSIVERSKKLQLRAPADGMVVYVQHRGERVKKGFEARPGWPLMSIPDLSEMQVKLFVNEVDRSKVHVGQKARIVLEAYPDAEFHGTITNVARMAQVVTGEERLKGFVAYISIEGNDPRLKPGMTAKVNILLETLKDAVFIPIGCLFEIAGRPVVFPKGKNEPVAVDLGWRNDGYIVVERGLAPDIELSWNAPRGKASRLGSSQERKRIDEVTRLIRESFSIFRERGMLHDYEGRKAEVDSAGPGRRRKMDWDKLPPEIRQRLKDRRGAARSPGAERSARRSNERRARNEK